MKQGRDAAHLFLCSAILTLSGCALQPPANTTINIDRKPWSSSPASVTQTADALSNVSKSVDEKWWRSLNDSRIDEMVEAAEASSPTVAKALARIEEARASVALSDANSGPRLGADASAKRGSSQTPSASAQTSVAANLSLSWEIDLFGRLRHNAAASQQRLLARESDARYARLSLQAQVVDNALALQACQAKVLARTEDLRSRRETLRLTALRESVGQVAPIETARAKSSELDSATQLSNSELQCKQLENALVALTDWSAQRVRDAFGAVVSTASARVIAKPVRSALALPASILLQHPNVVAALRSADASYEEIGSADAARYPSVSLSALLGQSWLRALGATSDSTTWSLGSSLTGSLVDGGAGRANVASARARHAQAMAQLENTLRTTTQEIENVLAQMVNAESRDGLTVEALNAAQKLLTGSEASYRAGRMSLFELEDARRSFNNATIARIDAERDLVQSWVSLVKATGNALPSRT